MLDANEFVDPLIEQGFNFWTGVPCSILTPLINYVIDHPEIEYVGAASEGEAVAIACGAQMAGKKSVMLCQNSGLGNAVNPLTSLVQTFKFPFLLLTSWRGAPEEIDEPQHHLMGEISPKLLEMMKIKHAVLPKESEPLKDALYEALYSYEAQGLPYAFIIKKNSFVERCLKDTSKLERVESEESVYGSFKNNSKDWISKQEALTCIRGFFGQSTAFIASTGKLGRELYSLGHCSNQFYMVGSMGCASAIGLGVTLACPDKKIVILDGDGALLMKMGNLSTIGFYTPRSFLHIVLDNEVHDSTGAQSTVSSSVDFAQVALACQYTSAYRCDNLIDLSKAIHESDKKVGPVLVHLKIKPGSSESLGRPNLSPEEVRIQFSQWLQS